MKLIDLHCDTLWAFSKARSQGVIENLTENSFCVDVKKMKKAQSTAQFFACFMYPQSYFEVLKMLALSKEIFHPDLGISLTDSYEALMQNEKEGQISAFHTVEDGGVLEGDMQRLEHLHQEGIRLITLTWNYENCIGFPNSRDKRVMECGLKPFGIEVVDRMNEMGMIIDVSHLSDGGFWDVLRSSKKPIVASHSNARSLCAHPRNLSDDMIKALANQGGIAGVNFYPYFVHENGKCTMEDIADHFAHLYQVGGEDFVAIGTDFDGFDEGESNLTNIGQMGLLYDIVKKRGFTESQMEKFWCNNVKRLIKDVL